MPHCELIDCRIKIQICVGYFPDGRMRTRTFGIKDVRPDVSADDVAAVARVLAPLLAHPVVCVRLVRKYVLRTTGAPRRSQNGTRNRVEETLSGGRSVALRTISRICSFLFGLFPIGVSGIMRGGLRLDGW